MEEQLAIKVYIDRCHGIVRTDTVSRIISRCLYKISINYAEFDAEIGRVINKTITEK